MTKLKRWLGGSFWYVVVMGAGIAWFYLAPVGLVELWCGLPVLALVLWPAIAKLRERVHF